MSGQRRAAWARGVPVRIEHDVLDDEPLAAPEQVREAGGAVRHLERMLFCRSRPLAGGTGRRSAHPLAGLLLLPGEQRLPRKPATSPWS
jgi:hypothetical protein